MNFTSLSKPPARGFSRRVGEAERPAVIWLRAVGRRRLGGELASRLLFRLDGGLARFGEGKRSMRSTVRGVKFGSGRAQLVRGDGGADDSVEPVVFFFVRTQRPDVHNAVVSNRRRPNLARKVSGKEFVFANVVSKDFQRPRIADAR